MSDENIEPVKRGFEALNRRDIDAVLELCHPEVELIPSLVGGIERTHFHGHDGYRAWFEQQFETYDEVTFTPHDFHAVGDQVLATYTTRTRGAQSGIELESPGATVLTIRAGQVVRQSGHQTREEALEAMGLCE